MNKVFDEQALLFEIERVFGRWGSHAEVYRDLLEKLHTCQIKMDVLLGCLNDIKSADHTDRMFDALFELDKLDNDARTS